MYSDLVSVGWAPLNCFAVLAMFILIHDLHDAAADTLKMGGGSLFTYLHSQHSPTEYAMGHLPVLTLVV